MSQGKRRLAIDLLAFYKRKVEVLAYQKKAVLKRLVSESDDLRAKKIKKEILAVDV